MDLTHFHPWFIGVFTNNCYIIESIYYVYKIRSDLEISDDFGAFWRYLEKASELAIEQDNWSTFRDNNRSMHTLGHRSTVKRA